MHLKKSLTRLQITVFKNCKNGHQCTKSTENKKFVFWINALTPIEKQSNIDWNTPIDL